MANALDLSTTAKRFRFVAIAEAITWVALLIGMAIKWIPDPNIDSAVRYPGMIHGAVFVIYLVVTVLTAVKLKWSAPVTLVALLASVPPFGTVVFERWAVRAGRLAELSDGGATSRSVTA
jgi:integral membrane protein